MSTRLANEDLDTLPIVHYFSLRQIFALYLAPMLPKTEIFMERRFFPLCYYEKKKVKDYFLFPLSKL